MAGPSSPLPKDAPLMIAWEAWQKTAEYANALGWAESVTVRFSVTDPPVTQSHAHGSLWAAFMAAYLTLDPDGAKSPAAGAPAVNIGET